MGKAVVVISYDQPEGVDEGFEKLTHIAETIRHLFEEESDVQVHVAIRETADEVLDIFKVG
jgi:hypothetical protein